MSPLLEGIPAFIYSLLWTRKIFGKLEKLFPDLQIKMVLLLTDFPPATSIEINKGDFKVEVLEDVKKPEDLDNIECDAYLALPTEVFYGGAEGIMKGINEKKVKIKNYEILTILGKLTVASFGGG